MPNSARIVFLCIRWPAHPFDENELGTAVALRAKTQERYDAASVGGLVIIAGEPAELMLEPIALSGAALRGASG